MSKESKKIISGIKWSSIQFALDTFFRLSVKLVLAKLLVPEQFGLVGMCAVFITVAGAAAELGMSSALIQRKDDSEARLLYSTAFWSGIVWGVLMYLIMSLVIGPFASYFYNEPKLLYLFPALSIGVLIKPLTSIHTVILIRNMNFKKIAKISNSSSLVAGIIAVFIAYVGGGIWALVINNAIAPILMAPFLFYTTKWKPKMEWKKGYFKQIFGFGVYSTGTGIFSTLTYNIDNLIIGKFLGASSLGLYTIAFSLTEQLRQTISNILNKVMFPVFGKNQDNSEVLKGLFLTIIYINAILVYPLMGSFLLFAEDIILLLLGTKWIGVVQPLQILSLAMMVHLLINSFTSLIRGMGKPAVEMKIIIGLTLVILLPGLFVGIKYWGLTGAAFAILINKICLVSVGLYVLKKEINLSWFSVFNKIKGPLIGIFLASVIVVSLKILGSIKSFFLLESVFLIVYSSIIYKMEKLTILKILKKIKK